MNEIVVSALYHSLIKSCARPRIDSLVIGENGPDMGRFWMVVGPDGKFRLSDTYPKMVLIKPRLVGSELILDNKTSVPVSDNGKRIEVEMFEHHKYPAIDDGDEAAGFFNEFLNIGDCRLVHLPKDYIRTDSRGLARLNLADSWSMTISGDQSLADLNKRIEKNGRKSVPRERFGHDMWFSGGEPYAEDNLEEFTVEDKLTVRVGKPIKRCGRTGIRREAATWDEVLKKDIEPNATLAEYRKLEDQPGVYFGQKLAPIYEGKKVEIGVGDRINVTKTKPHPHWVVKKT